ncbi:DUF6528 family protein [Planctomycetes bacterium K23_9]|uniref:Uncharacterized protein n=1 Tax=Stieleria marina TaxID=1930275 RepID=A0A517NVH0_9BACT|nr:hypothetical protein K239x_31030 [Planctomycetes bacterium K23_9]
MMTSIRIFISAAFVFALICHDLYAVSPDAAKIICCGAEKVFVVDPAKPSQDLWSWTASDSPSIPEAFRSRFRSTDDCKPYENDLMLITSSSRGVALIERTTKRCVFLAEVANAHSACLLPDHQIAVAASTSGDAVEFFSQNDSARPAVAVFKIPLRGAHGTVWDAAGTRLWALGTDELLEIKPQGKAASPVWVVAERHPLPSSGGHDLSPAHDGKNLFVTTNTQVLQFDTTDKTFTVVAGFGSGKKIKSVDVHPISKRIVFHQALADEWWSHSIRFKDAPPITLADERLYKIRWDVPAKKP